MAELLTIRTLRSDGLILCERDLETGMDPTATALAADSDTDQAMAALSEGYGVVLEVWDPIRGLWLEVPGTKWEPTVPDHEPRPADG